MYDLKDDRWIKNGNQLKPMKNKVILTFDDGPSRQLNHILDILSEKNVPAIFFWQSRLLYKQRPWLRVINEGHIIGAHSCSHRNLCKLERAIQYKEIKKSIDMIEDTTQSKVQYFRPPYGRYNEDTMSILKDLNLTPVMWEISSYDWENKLDPDKIVCNIENHIVDGSIILLHELKQTVTVLPKLIDKVRMKGFEFTLL